MYDDFFDDEKKHKGISITFFIVAILLIALISSTVTYFLIPNYKAEKRPDITPAPIISNESNVKVDVNLEELFTSLYEENCNTVVVIDGFILQNGKETHYSQSSGFIISDDGYILTNHHCVEGMDKITVMLYSGECFDGKVIGSDDRTEVAVIKIDTDLKLKKAVLGDSDKIKIGQYAIAIGNPVGYEYSMSIGFVSGVEREVDSNNFRYKMIQVDTPLNSGNSGGPLFNSSGEVIGINTMKSSSYTSVVEGIGFAIPINVAKQIAEELIQNGKVTRAAIEASVGTYTGENGGALVAEVTKGGAAEKAGILSGDIIISFNNKKIASVNDLIAELENCKPNQEIDITIIRNQSEEIKLKIILGTT